MVTKRMKRSHPAETEIGCDDDCFSANEATFKVSMNSDIVVALLFLINSTNALIAAIGADLAIRTRLGTV
jgi:hypothetical protein